MRPLVHLNRCQRTQQVWELGMEAPAKVRIVHLPHCVHRSETLTVFLRLAAFARHRPLLCCEHHHLQVPLLLRQHQQSWRLHTCTSDKSSPTPCCPPTLQSRLYSSSRLHSKSTHVRQKQEVWASASNNAHDDDERPRDWPTLPPKQSFIQLEFHPQLSIFRVSTPINAWNGNFAFSASFERNAKGSAWKKLSRTSIIHTRS